MTPRRHSSGTSKLYMPRILFLAILLFAIPAQAVVTIDWVTVGNAGNTPDTKIMGTDGTTGYGSVGVVYRIGKYEVTNSQYTEFLNAVASTDTYALYNTRMGDPPLPFEIAGGITRSGTSGSYSYSAIAGRENMPVNFVSFYDALRFANWLHNGQPTGAQDGTTTEDGAYTITAQGIADNSITRNPEATVFLTSEDEWYKAAYHGGFGVNSAYWDSPTRSFTWFQPPGIPLPPRVYTGTVCAAPGATANTANCGNAVADLTAVGSYTGSSAPYGTFDQGGNVWEWNEAILNVWSRGVRGGAYSSLQLLIGGGSSTRGGGNPAEEGGSLGFRVASPEAEAVLKKGLEPASIPALSPVGLIVVAAGLLGLVGYRRIRA